VVLWIPTITNDRTKQKAMEAIMDIYGKQLIQTNNHVVPSLLICFVSLINLDGKKSYKIWYDGSLQLKLDRYVLQDLDACFNFSFSVIIIQKHTWLYGQLLVAELFLWSYHIYIWKLARSGQIVRSVAEIESDCDAWL